MHRALLLIAAIATVLAAGVPGVQDPPTSRPEARAETDPVPNRGDAADDPAVWLHPRDPGSSLILGTDKRGGLHSYNMDGSEHDLVAEGTRPNNVDVLYGFELEGRSVDLAVASVQASRGLGVKVWAIDPETRRLADVTDGGRIQVHGGAEPYGLCAYRSPRTGRFYFFVTDSDGAVEQYQLEDAVRGRVAGTKVREFGLGSVAEGCVADHELGFAYFAEETAGIWKFDAEPNGGRRGRPVARVGDNSLAADVEGLAIYYAPRGRGYLIASSQGDNSYKVYERGGDNRYVLTIDPVGGRIDDVSDTDGLDVTSCPTSREFARGLFIVQDGRNADGNQNFKLYAWEDVAGSNLLIDTVCRGGTRAP